MATIRENKLRMAQLVCDYQEIGINEFPREYIEKYCPFVRYEKKHKWYRSASNVWNLRNGDSKIIEAFEKAYNDAKNEFESIQ